MHVTVLLQEAIDALAIKPDGVYVDGTFGRGGHSRLILEKLGQHGRLIAFDKDPQAVASGNEVGDARFQMAHSGFKHIATVLGQLGIVKVDGVLLDLGVSSMQLDEAARGFSFRFDAPLDMRMDTSRGQTAAMWLASVSEAQLREVIKDYGEERFARQIARAVVAARARQPILTTRQLAEIVKQTVRARDHQQNPATRTFQAIRIYLNAELEELNAVLPQCVSLLDPGGRLAVISFHSLEDRLVKQFMRGAADTDTLPRRLPLKNVEVENLSRQQLRLVGKAVRPGAAEVSDNPRARSAVMRVAEKTADKNA